LTAIVKRPTGAGRLLLQVRRARPGHGRHQTPVGGTDRRRGARPVQPGRARRHRPHGRLHGRPGERFQRGGQQVRDSRARGRKTAPDGDRPDRARGGRQEPSALGQRTGR